MSKTSRFRFDLGLSTLTKDWKELFSLTGLKEDVIAGATVACIAIPLSLAIALASGVEPSVGLITAIVASMVCALFGGTPLAVSGPAASMAVLVASIVQQFGLGGLIFVGIGCGILQILTGFFGLGRAVRFVPVPVVAGFTAGIGALLFIGQLPRALGLPPPDQSHIFDVIIHIRDLINQSEIISVILALTAITITFLLPKLSPRLPAALIALIVPSFLVAIFGIPTQTIGNIPNSLPFPKLPNFPQNHLFELLSVSFMVYALASLETLLSSSSVDTLSTGPRHDPDQELIGQGLGNIFSSMFGGIPATAVIARSALNIQAGAKTRRAAIVHAVVLILTVYFFASWMNRIPMAVLAGVLLSVSLRMLHPREFLELWRSSHFEAIIYLVTFYVIVFVDLFMGIQAGVGAALIIAAVRLGNARTNVKLFDLMGPLQISINGPLTFLSTSKMEEIRQALKNLKPGRGVVLEMSEVRSIDASGASQLYEVLELMMNQHTKFALRGLDPECRRVLMSLDNSEKIAKYIAANESDTLLILGEDGQIPHGVDRLIYGVEQFQREIKAKYGNLFEKLATGQSPHTLFITCSDSRINPNLITATDPGELFIVRNVGNIIPPFGDDGTPAEGAAVEYALGVLGVKEIVVCGHSGCGAMAAILSQDLKTGKLAKQYPNVATWLEVASADVNHQLPSGSTPEKAAELNSLLQVQNLKTYPIIREKLEKNQLRIRAWYYNIGNGELEEWDEKRKIFVTVGSDASRSLEKRIEAGIQYQVPIK